LIARSVLVAGLAAALAAPAAHAQDGSGGVVAPAAAPPVQAATASGGGVELSVLPSGTAGQPVLVHGTAPRRTAGHQVKLQLQNPATLRWKKVTGAKVARDGTFTERWKPRTAGQYALRAVLDGASAPLAVTVYQAALATWYGPGLWGNQTACGQILTPDLLGVAHKSLPCGTPVTLTYGGRTITVPVIDRGPYGVPGAQYDLTQATAFMLGMLETETVGALPQPVAAASR
jgi:peptidoglycan lytic transglycosylase